VRALAPDTEALVIGEHGKPDGELHEPDDPLIDDVPPRGTRGPDAGELQDDRRHAQHARRISQKVQRQRRRTPIDSSVMNAVSAIKKPVSAPLQLDGKSRTCSYTSGAATRITTRLPTAVTKKPRTRAWDLLMTAHLPSPTMAAVASAV
jgi:hypothetical protein